MDIQAWNEYLTPVNRKIIELDNDREKQKDYIFDVFHDMQKHDFDKEIIVEWFNSQMQITGNQKFAGMFDFTALYSDIFGLSSLLKKGFEAKMDNNIDYASLYK